MQRSDSAPSTRRESVPAMLAASGRENARHGRGRAGKARGEAIYSDARAIASRRLAAWEYAPTEFVQSLDAVIRARPGLKVVLWARVSRTTRAEEDNLPDQKRRMMRELGKRGVDVLKVFSWRGAGRTMYLSWKAELSKAARFALAHGAVLVAESPSRFLRSDEYEKRLQWIRPTRKEWEQLRIWTRGVLLATLLDPGSSPSEERGAQTRRGQLEKGAMPGRPRKTRPGEMKQRRQEYVARVRELRRSGYSWNEIVNETGVKRSTARDWAEAE